MPQNICFKCCIKFEDAYEMFIICFICRKYFCIKCYGNHKHNNVESYYEDLYNIIKDKNDTLYKPLPICDWNTSFEVAYEMFIICFICRKYFCIKCYGNHKHNNVESYYSCRFIL